MMRRLLSGIAVCAVLAGQAFGYAFFLHYTSASAPYGVAPEKFDLSALPGQTVTFFVSDDGPSVYTANDGYVSILSQVRQAAQAWNAVPGSALRVAFGGQFTPGTPQNGPGAQVVFEDLPPGVFGYGGPVSTGDLNTSGNAPFYPVSLARMHLSRNLAKPPGPSYTDSFFLVTVHEMGHALGLQHTFTSSVMSTVFTRATSALMPIDADDAAGLSTLYPTNDFAASTGHIQGHVRFNRGGGVHLASVVAIRPGAPAISAMTLPDGSFDMTGVPPGDYYVYAHALPPTADIINPKDVNGNEVPPGVPFDTVFFPGTRDFHAAALVTVQAGKSTPGISLRIAPKDAVGIYGASIYSFFGSNPVRPGRFNATPGSGTVVASGIGLGANGATRFGLNVQTMGGGTTVTAIRPYSAYGFTYLALDLKTNAHAQAGVQHMVFYSPDSLYVLPSAFSVVTTAPPQITSLSRNPDGSVAVSATGLTATSQIYFDGLPGMIQSLDLANGNAVVLPPAGAPGQTALVTIYNQDTQNSRLASQSADTYTLDAAGAPSVSLSPAGLPGASEATVDIRGNNTHFAAGSTSVGFGSSDIYVRQLFVLSPTHLLANISIPSTAAQTATETTVMTGFESVAVPSAFQIGAPVPGKPVCYPQLFNAIAGQAGTYPGAIVTLYGWNLQADSSTATVNFDGRQASVLYSSANQINLVVPGDLGPGPSMLTVNSGTDVSFPVAINIDPPQAVIAAVNTTSPVTAGTLVDVLLYGLAGSSAAIAPGRVQAKVGGIALPVASITAGDGGFHVRFVLSSAVPAGDQPLIVYMDGRSSTEARLKVDSSGN